LQTADAVVAINMIHVAPWSATLALFEGARALLSTEQVLFLYGPYRRSVTILRRVTRSSILIFVRRSRVGPSRPGGVSDVAAGAGFVLAETVEMPANNFSLVFKRGEG
jgi:hypothetical protein